VKQADPTYDPPNIEPLSYDWLSDIYEVAKAEADAIKDAEDTQPEQTLYKPMDDQW